ncbi:MAG: amidohydrolase family protein, partial [Deltaproteobacteria bacterium]|nr:amidohydrolase family protein [Deltaproteobacteria bacterium]
MKIIDFHTHFFPDRLMDALWRWFETHAWPIEYKQYADQAVEQLKAEGVTHCVSLHYPHKPEMADGLNAFAHELGKKFQDFITPFGSLHPDDAEKASILRRCFEDFGFKGLKFHCHVQKMAPEDPRMEEVYEICQAYDRIVLLHCGNGPHFKDKPTQGYGYDVTSLSGAKHFEKIVKKYPKLRFIVPHLGFEEMDAFIGMLKDNPNLYLDTTMAIGGYFPNPVHLEWLAENPDKLLFGTDFQNIPYP